MTNTSPSSKSETASRQENALARIEWTLTYSVFNIKELLDSWYVGAGHSVNFSAN